jgi:hypothetical protein
MVDWFFRNLFPLVVIGIALLIPLIIYAAIVDAREWEEFKAKHNCKVVAHVRGSTSIGVGFNSNGGTTIMPITEPDKTGWQCDDGVTYYR